MKSKKLKITSLIFFAILCCSLLVSFLNYGSLGMPFNGVQPIASISNICSDNNGGMVITDDGGYEVIHVNSDGKAVAVLPGKSTDESGYYFAASVICDSESNIYILTKELSGDSDFAIVAEYIKKFAPDGTYLETVAEIKHEKPIMKCSVKKMQFIDGELYYYTLTDAGVKMHPLEGEPKLFSYLYAADYIRDVLYAPEQDLLYTLSYNGIVSAIGDGASNMLYNAPATDPLSVPWSLSLADDGTLYICDIGYRTIQSLKDGQYDCFFYNYEYTSDYDPETRRDCYIHYVADFSNGFLTANSDEVVYEQDGELVSAAEFEFDSKTLTSIRAFYIAAAISCVALLYFLVIAAIRIVKSDSSAVKMSVVVISLTVAVAALFVALTFSNFNDRLLDEVHDRQDSLSVTLDKTLPTDSFLALDELSSFGGKDYMAVKKTVDDLLLDDDGKPGDLYCVLYSINDAVITSRYTLEEAYGINYPYDWDYYGADEEYIITHDEGKFYSALNNSEGNFMFILSPLHDDDGKVIGLVEIGTDLTAFSEANQTLIRDLLINILVMSVIIIMIALEVIAFINNRKKLKGFLAQGNKLLSGAARANLLRVVVFLVFFVTNITTCFLSYYALSLAEDGQTILGLQLPAEILAAFPISAEVLTGAIFSFIGSFFIKKLGRRNCGIVGGILFTGGLCVRFIQTSLLTLTIGNAIQGCGWGLVLLVINTMIAEEQNSESVQEGFVNYNAALQNGMNSGIVFGGFLIHWMSYRSILVFAAGLSVLVLLFSTVYFTKDKLGDDTNDTEVKQISFLRFLFKPRILIYFIAIVIPIIAAGYYLNYLYPIIGEDLGLSETYLGYSYLLNGLAVICLGNLLVKKLSRKLSRPIILLIASIIYFVAFFVVGRFQNIPALLFALVFLGISDSFGYSTQTSYYSELPEVKQYGYSRAMGVYSLFENISQTAGSFIFGYVLVIGLERGLQVFGAIIAILAVVFVLASFFGRKRKVATITVLETDKEGALSHD